MKKTNKQQQRQKLKKIGVVLLQGREPRRRTDADLKMANETRVLIHVIVEA